MRRPSSCSVTTIEAISAAAAEAARPVTSSAESTGPELADQREADHRAEALLRAEAHQRVVALQAEHHADREPRDADDREREHADVVELVEGAAQAQRAASRARRDHRDGEAPRARRAPSTKRDRARAPSRATARRAALTRRASRRRPRRTRARAGSRAARGSPPARPRRAAPSTSTTTWSAMRSVDSTWCEVRIMVTAKRRFTREEQRLHAAHRGGVEARERLVAEQERAAAARARARARRASSCRPRAGPGSSSSTPSRSTASKMRCTSARISASRELRVLAQRQRDVVEDR